jgi:hypothetical protein
MDIQLLCGQDFSISANGDLATSDGAQEGQERVLRRLMTSNRSYIHHLNYGAGLPRYLGTPIVQATLKAVILQQMKLEAAVQQSPPPVVTVSYDNTNTVIANIRYIDANTQLTSVVVVPIG